MKILIIGNGKMGREIKNLATEMNHEIEFIIDRNDDWKIFDSGKYNVDVAIEFTTPEAAPNNILECFKRNLPVVCGSTGWHDKLEHISNTCLEQKQSLIYASNFSPGMNVAFEINRQLAKIMNNFANYSIHIEETHHIHKIDSPSGTAVSLAKDLIAELDRKNSWLNESTEDDKLLSILSRREGDVTGEHDVIYESTADIITLSHKAKNRKGFALGALIAADWIKDKTGVYTMKDLIQQLSKS